MDKEMQKRVEIRLEEVDKCVIVFQVAVSIPKV